jgi:hypothetical protein
MDEVVHQKESSYGGKRLGGDGSEMTETLKRPRLAEIYSNGNLREKSLLATQALTIVLQQSMIPHTGCVLDVLSHRESGLKTEVRGAFTTGIAIDPTWTDEEKAEYLQTLDKRLTSGPISSDRFIDNQFDRFIHMLLVLPLTSLVPSQAYSVSYFFLSKLHIFFCLN